MINKIRRRIESLSYWLEWKFCFSIEEGTCFYIKRHTPFDVEEYQDILHDNDFNFKDYFDILYPVKYKQLRRKMMFEFLVIRGGKY